MQRLVDSRVFMLLEGPTDCQALEPQIESSVAMTVPGHCKENVLQALALSEEREMQHVLALVDLDWDGLLRPMVTSENVVYTDDYDLESTMAFSGDVLDRVISNISSSVARNTHLAEVGLSMRELVIELAGTMGLLRYVSSRDQHGLRCRKLPAHEVLTSTRHAVDTVQLVRIVVARSPNCSITEVAAVNALEKEREASSERRRFCNGHDVASVIGALAHHWSGNGSRSIVEQAIRIAFGCSELKETALYEGVLDWCQKVGVPSVWSCA
jgi:hypothetical protein